MPQLTTYFATLLLASVFSTTAKAASDPAAAERVLEQRCIVCHGCYDAPCQLKLEANEGLVRGGTLAPIYDGTRLRAADLTRLFDDAQSEQEWRAKGFHPVIDREAPEQGVMYRLLELKQENPLPTNEDLTRDFDFSLYRDQTCPTQEEFDSYAREHPLWGMPYGLPGLNQDEHNTLISWLEEGAPAASMDALSAQQQATLQHWETFLNTDDKRSQLVARYLYEHLFLASLYLEVEEQPAWFRLIRSRTGPGQPIDVIATRRPYDDPGAGHFYYRLQRMPTAPLAKTHMPYRLDQARLEEYRELFLGDPWQLDTLPGFDAATTSNPFKRFEAIPVAARYRFLLGEAQFTIMNFIKGPVCRGQIALNVIDDHFWVMFANPDKLDPVEDANFLAREMDNLYLPEPRTGTLLDLLSWRKYAKANRSYHEARAQYIEKELNRDERKLDLDAIWDGDGNNANAALTIFRHFDTASVVKGFVGETPKTAWVISYPLLEKIHYLLAAGFDVYGAVAHQLESRLYMDFLRMEGEFNFLMYLPADERPKLWNYWYRDAPHGARKYFDDSSELSARPSDIEFQTSDPKNELLQTLRGRIHGATAKRYDYHSQASSVTTEALRKLELATGAHNSFLPQVSFLNVISEQRDEAYTLIANSGYSNIAQLFKEQKRRIPAEDSLTVVSGFIGAYPNYFFQVNEKQIPLFAAEVQAMESLGDLAELKARYGVRRDVPWFWHLSDKLHRISREQDGIEFGLFDYNRYAAQ
ncbi:peptidylprolyl isomerase [Halioglobus maricola]|uniref:Peptidylprolyl isomerase n=1 Tax=Halioglobus maricola TaxID=2601894 RepID=A0A5P9NPM9_9GAMM|nr:fatty acid cis/trans isomerase [Halioglobus maricola]QFU76858.1 peptidylprolyl isomerase [Halioglobus maricola]